MAVQNAAARLLTGKSKNEHISPILASLHWLPVHFWIHFKIISFAFKALNGLAPPYFWATVPLHSQRTAGQLTSCSWQCQKMGLNSSICHRSAFYFVWALHFDYFIWSYSHFILLYFIIPLPITSLILLLLCYLFLCCAALREPCVCLNHATEIKVNWIGFIFFYCRLSLKHSSASSSTMIGSLHTDMDISFRKACMSKYVKDWLLDRSRR